MTLIIIRIIFLTLALTFDLSYIGRIKGKEEVNAPTLMLTAFFNAMFIATYWV